ncbi:MAG: thrombospondin type 3 repeat-containing protein [bacterium]
MKKYLPSEKFIRLIIGFAVLGIVFLVVYLLFSSKTNFLSSKNGTLQTQNLTVNELIKKDSDGDGVLDWEEALWGTDPNKAATFDNIPDKTYVENKRKELKVANPEDPATNTTNENNETAKFARQFFASIAAMKQNGDVSAETINNVSNALGQNIINPTMIDKYTEADIKIAKGDLTQDQEDYYVKAANLFEKYKAQGIGDELEIIGGMAGTGVTNKDSVDKLNTIATAYQEYAQKMTVLPVPESLKTYHIQIINSSNNTGISVKDMIKITDDPIVGLSGLSQYEKYSQDLITSVGNLETFLSVNGIINQ